MVCHFSTLVLQVCLQFSIKVVDIANAADIWNITLDSAASDDIAYLVWGSVFIEYLSHINLIPSHSISSILLAYERYLQEAGGETTALFSSTRLINLSLQVMMSKRS